MSSRGTWGHSGAHCATAPSVRLKQTYIPGFITQFSQEQFTRSPCSRVAHPRNTFVIWARPRLLSPLLVLAGIVHRIDLTSALVTMVRLTETRQDAPPPPDRALVVPSSRWCWHQQPNPSHIAPRTAHLAFHPSHHPMQRARTIVPAIRTLVTVVALALACLVVAARGAAATGRSLAQVAPNGRQFVQFELFLRGPCSKTLAAMPNLPNRLRLAAIADVRARLTAEPTGSANLSATLASVRAFPSTCQNATVCPDALAVGASMAVPGACVLRRKGGSSQATLPGSSLSCILTATAARARTCTHRTRRPAANYLASC